MVSEFYDPSDDEVRRENRYELLGTRNPKCKFCSETDPDALTGKYPNIVCYEHLLISEGKQPIEKHHPSGEHNDPDFTVPIPGNDHRILSNRQNYDWPDETLRNPNGSILRKAAAAIRGFLDMLRLIIDRAVGWIPDYLEWLDSALNRHIGSEWGKTLRYECFR